MAKRSPKRPVKRQPKPAPRPTARAPATAPRSGEPAAPDELRLIVGVGASAGGFEAFRTFLGHFPAQTGMALVYVQHLDPTRKSLLVELLGRLTDMPVLAAEDGAALTPDRVYVIPPDATLTVANGTLHLAVPAPAREFRRPIDSFLTSLAEDQGELAVGIILSGGGSDGTEGVRALKENGGLTLAQASGDDHAMTGMPGSAAATGQVDFVLPVEAMPAKLIEYRRHLIAVRAEKGSDGTRQDAAKHLTRIFHMLRQAVGHDFSHYKEKTLVRRIQRRMQVLQIDDVPAYIEHLQKQPGELQLLFQEMLIGVTRFFRDAEVFEALEHDVIAKIVEQKTGADEAIRVWVPGCATGEEAYSIAILIREATIKHRISPSVQIFGTDIDDQAIQAARSARYRLAQVEGVTPARLKRWFTNDGDSYSPIREIREMCIFATHSVIKDPPFSRIDLVSCRNLLIYLDPELQERLARVFHYALRPGGFLFLGTSESLGRNNQLFTVAHKGHRFFLRQRGAAIGQRGARDLEGGAAVGQRGAADRQHRAQQQERRPEPRQLRPAQPARLDRYRHDLPRLESVRDQLHAGGDRPVPATRRRPRPSDHRDRRAPELRRAQDRRRARAAHAHRRRPRGRHPGGSLDLHHARAPLPHGRQRDRRRRRHLRRHHGAEAPRA